MSPNLYGSVYHNEPKSPPILKTIGNVLLGALQAGLGYFGNQGTAGVINIDSPMSDYSQLDSDPYIEPSYEQIRQEQQNRWEQVTNPVPPNLITTPLVQQNFSNNDQLASFNPTYQPSGAAQAIANQGVQFGQTQNSSFQPDQGIEINQQVQSLPSNQRPIQGRIESTAQTSYTPPYRHVERAVSVPWVLPTRPDPRAGFFQQVNQLAAERKQREFTEALRANAHYRQGSQRLNAINELQKGETLSPEGHAALAHAQMVEKEKAKKAAEEKRRQENYERLKATHFKPGKSTSTGTQFNELVDSEGSPIETTKRLPPAGKAVGAVLMSKYLQDPDSEIIPWPLRRGEKAVGKNTGNPPKPLEFSSEADLKDKLWDNYYHGEGQPVEIDLSKLDFNDNLRFEKLVRENGAYSVLKQPVIDQAELEEGLGRKVMMATNGNQTQIHIDIIDSINLHFDEFRDFDEFAAFGQLSIDLREIVITVDHSRNNQVRVTGKIFPRQPNSKNKLEKNQFDDFDFNKDNRGFPKEEIVTLVREYWYPGTSFRVFAKDKSFSTFDVTF